MRAPRENCADARVILPRVGSTEPRICPSGRNSNAVIREGITARHGEPPHYLILGFLFLLLLAPAPGTLRVFAIGLPTEQPVQLIRAHVLSLRRFCCQPVRQVP